MPEPAIDTPLRFRIKEDHPSLAGHFPGRPIVPGVVVLDNAIALISRDRLSDHQPELVEVKFLAPVLPGEDVTVSYSENADSLVIACEVAGRPVLRGRLRLGDRE